MGFVYNEKKKEYEDAGFMPFVFIIKSTPEGKAAAMSRFSQVFATPEGKGIKGVHGWNLMGRDTMIVIAWANSPVSIQKFCTSISFGSGLSIDVCPAIDHFGLSKAFEELKSRLPKIPVPKVSGRKSGAS